MQRFFISIQDVRQPAFLQDFCVGIANRLAACPPGIPRVSYLLVSPRFSLRLPGYRRESSTNLEPLCFNPGEKTGKHGYRTSAPNKILQDWRHPHRGSPMMGGFFKRNGTKKENNDSQLWSTTLEPTWCHIQYSSNRLFTQALPSLNLLYIF